jgi:hypothetical protein
LVGSSCSTSPARAGIQWMRDWDRPTNRNARRAVRASLPCPLRETRETVFPAGFGNQHQLVPNRSRGG